MPSEKYHFQIEDHAVSFFIHDLTLEDGGEYTLMAAGEAMTTILKVTKAPRALGTFRGSALPASIDGLTD